MGVRGTAGGGSGSGTGGIVAGIVVETTTARTITAADNGMLIRCTNSSPITVTFPQTSAEALSAGFNCSIEQAGLGQVTVAFQGSDASETAGTLVTPRRYAVLNVIKTLAGSPNTWLVTGGLTRTAQRRMPLSPDALGTSYTNTATLGSSIIASGADGSRASYRRAQFPKDATNVRYAGILLKLPASWDVTAAPTIDMALVTLDASPTGTKIQMKASLDSYAAGDNLDTALSALTNINCTYASRYGVIMPAAVALTVGNTPTAGDLLFLRLARDSTTGNSANDDYSGDAYLLDLGINWTELIIDEL